MKLEVEGLSAGYGTATVVRNVSLEVDSGQTLGVLGRNGMGKTTLVRAILGYLSHSSGKVRVDDRDVGGWPTFKIVRLGIGYGPQDAAIFPDRTVHENLLLGSLRSRHLAPQIDEVLADFPVLRQRLRQAAGTLSGGEQRMLILARTLICRPRLLILDEISEGLQPLVLGKARDALRREQSRNKTTIVMIEQSVDFALSLCDRVLVLQAGQVLFSRPGSDPALRGEIEKAFAL